MFEGQESQLRVLGAKTRFPYQNLLYKQLYFAFKVDRTQIRLKTSRSVRDMTFPNRGYEK